ncbi:MAG: AcrB/AcrD/AcrF family protein [Bdellovibrio sp.]|nr:MAG: AcrB/AcrD/AcrF family protein [Bdellovibrio sp.]
MSLPSTSIYRPVLAWMMMFALLVFGGISFSRMGISQMPDVNFPVVNIGLQMDNAAPEVMEMDVVDVIEDVVMGIEGLKNVTSNSSQGIANITCEFDLNRDIDVAMQEVQTRISQAAKRLPTQLYPPVITKTNPEDKPILWVMITNDGGSAISEQMLYARNTLKDQLSTVAGVGNIILGGYVDTNLRVWLDPKRLEKNQLTATDVSAAITAEQIEQPAGRIEDPQKEFNIRVLGEASNPLDFGKIRISTRAGGPNYRPIPLKDVAEIAEDISDFRAISRFDGKTAVGLGVVKQHGANAVQVATLIKEKVAKMQPSLWKGYHMDVRMDTTRFIHESVSELNFTLILSALLTSLVCYLFLGSWSSTINVLLSIPTSIVGAFIVLYFMGFTLNTFTLLGLSLAIGIVVDDAIMMLENIVRHREMGKSKLRAALEGAEEITFAAMAATVAIAAIFIPVIFMKGVVGKYFYQYGITVTVAVFLSLLEALTLTPMRTSRFLQSSHDHPGWLLKVMDRWMESLSQSYRRILVRLLRHRWKVVLASLLIFVTSVFFLGSLNKELIPSQDQSLFLLNIQAPVGTSIWATNEIFKKAETFLRSQPEVQDLYTTIGNYNGNDIVNAGNIYVILKPAPERGTPAVTQRQFMDRSRDELEKLLPGMKIFNQDLSLTGFSASRGYPVEFTVEGPEWLKLVEFSRELISRLNSTHLVTDINSDYQDGMPELQVIPNRDRAAARGVSISSMGQEVSSLIGGQKFTANTQYPKQGHRYDIRIRSNEHERPEDLANLRVWNNRGTGGELVPLKDVAEIRQSSAPQIISRVNRIRAIPIYANVVQGKSQDEALTAVEQAASEILPPGYRVVITGGAQSFRESFSNLMFALILGIAVAYMVLASQFNSFVHPLAVLMALPFSLSGALLALSLTHQSINLFSMIGLILLMGIVKKNSILLVDFTNQRRAEGLGPLDALLDACPVRLRPILMTSVACIAGAIPAALALGPGAETRVPMAISIIGGVTLSTLLTLFVVPCVYSLLVYFERPDHESLQELDEAVERWKKLGQQKRPLASNYSGRQTGPGGGGGGGEAAR